MSTTIRVQRANVVLDIRPEEKERYKEMGYSVIEVGTGKVLEEALSNDVNVLRAQVADLKKVIEDKDEEIKKLKATLSKKAKSDAKVSATKSEE
jgi:chaperonin cofactor prefoldin